MRLPLAQTSGDHVRSSAGGAVADRQASWRHNAVYPKHRTFPQDIVFIIFERRLSVRGIKHVHRQDSFALIGKIHRPVGLTLSSSFSAIKSRWSLAGNASIATRCRIGSITDSRRTAFKHVFRGATASASPGSGQLRYVPIVPQVESHPSQERKIGPSFTRSVTEISSVQSFRGSVDFRLRPQSAERAKG